MIKNKTDKDYWDDFYQNKKLKKFSQRRMGLVNQHIVKYFKSSLANKRGKFIEFGCGNSFWIIYFAKHGYDVSGVDYSENGVDLIKRRLEQEGINGEIFKLDFFNMDNALDDSYDTVASFGVIEHFDDPSEVLKIFKKVMNKNGLLITGIPKLIGAQGYLQKKSDLNIYLKHNVMDIQGYIDEHKKAGMEVLLAKEVGFISLGLNPKTKKYINQLYRIYSKIINYFLRWILPIGFVNRFKIGSYFLIISKKQ